MNTASGDDAQKFYKLKKESGFAQSLIICYLFWTSSGVGKDSTLKAR